MSEYQFNSKMRKELAPFGFLFYRVESHQTCPGIPDCHFVHAPSGKSGWIEVKQELFQPPSVKYQPRQAAWLQSYALAGGRSLTALYLTQPDLILLIDGRYSVRAESRLWPGIAREVGPGSGRWETFSRVLLGEISLIASNT